MGGGPVVGRRGLGGAVEGEVVEVYIHTICACW